MAALHAHQRGDPAGGDGGVHLGRRAAQREVVGELLDELVHEVDLLVRGPYGVLAGQRAGHEHRPELAGDPTGAQAREVGLDGGLAGDERDGREVVAAVVAQRPGQVVVPVEDTDHRSGGHR